MNKRQKFMGVVLSLALFVGLMGGIGSVSEAAGSSYTLLKGEKIVITIFGTNISSVSSSKKSVIAVKKSGANKATVTAKKAGKAKVTVRGVNGGKKTYSFNVKTPKYSWKVVGVYAENNSYKITYEIVNKSGVYLSSGKFKYHLFDASGVEVKSDVFNVYRMIAGAKCYYTVSHYLTDGQTIGNATLTNDEYSHDFKYKYNNVSKKMKVNKVEKLDSNINFTIKNPTKESVDGIVDVVFYDAAGQIVGTSQSSMYMTSNSVTTKTVYAPTREWADYKYSIRAVYGKYIG